MSRTDPRPMYGAKRRIGSNGYVYLYRPCHPLAHRDGYVAEHRYVMWESGVRLDPGQDVHHVNRDKSDNRLENLVVLDRAAHGAEHYPVGSAVANQHGTYISGTGENHQRRARKAALGQRVCAGCPASITHLRADARYCSEPCRVRSWKRARRSVA